MRNAKVELEDNEELDLGLSDHQQMLMEQEQAELAAFTPIVELLALASPGDHPVEKDVRQWKNKYGKIYISTILDETDVYVWRPILRQEWRALQAKGGDSYDHAEALLEKCLLFPHLETVLYKRPAGVMPALETKIMFQSGFVSEQLLISSIREIN